MPIRALYLVTARSASLLHIHDRVGGLEPGQETNFMMVDEAATPLLRRRTRGTSLAERLFALMILGDNRRSDGPIFWENVSGTGNPGAVDRHRPYMRDGSVSEGGDRGTAI
jgi:hypothetical protein